ncbi:hypothetical protein O9992_16435 [Vibrio lentus]|nr:hypothetical protein [Vibrio lentus]
MGGEYTDGDRGQVAEATVTYDVSDDHSTYVTYVDDNYEGENNVIVGQRADLAPAVLRFYQRGISSLMKTMVTVVSIRMALVTT